MDTNTIIAIFGGLFILLLLFYVFFGRKGSCVRRDNYKPAKALAVVPISYCKTYCDRSRIHCMNQRPVFDDTCDIIRDNCYKKCVYSYAHIGAM